MHWVSFIDKVAKFNVRENCKCFTYIFKHKKTQFQKMKKYIEK